MKRATFPAALLFGLLFFYGYVYAQPSDQNASWLQFRGDHCSGIASQSSTPPSDFGNEKNVLWKIDTPEGYSSPIIIQDNLIITGVVREEKKYMVWDIDPLNGTIKWQREVPVDALEKVHPISSPAAATPASDGEFIYCFFPTFGLVCYDLEGEKIWERAVQFYPVPQGSGTSPIVYKDKVILNHDNYSNPQLLVFNKYNGEQLWEYTFPVTPMITSMSWSTPVIWHDQIIIHRLDEIAGVNMDTGEPIWQFDIGTTGVATPVIVGDTLFVNAWMFRGEVSDQGEVFDFQKMFNDCDADGDGKLSSAEFTNKYPDGVCIADRKIEGVYTGTRVVVYWGQLGVFDQDKDGFLSQEEWGTFQELMADFSNHGTVAFRLGGTGDITLNSTIWKSTENVPQIPSVAVENNLLYMVKVGGIVTCMDARNGDIMYAERVGAPGPYLSSPLLSDGMIFIASYNGKITILKEGSEFRIINQIDLGEKIGASPVAIDNRLYIRTDEHLYAFVNNNQ
jgi:outer membrane protein assembly factor BamB